MTNIAPREFTANFSSRASETELRAAEWLTDQIESDQELLGMLFQGELTVDFDGDMPRFDVPCTTEAVPPSVALAQAYA